MNEVSATAADTLGGTKPATVVHVQACDTPKGRDSKMKTRECSGCV